MRTGFVVSDLHLFAERSRAHHILKDLHDAAAAGEFLVLNGDIFDFKWSSLDSHEETVQMAADWISGLVKRHPHCQFHYVLGNHDAYAPFAHRLDALGQEWTNLTVHPTHVRLGDCLFLHGDLAMGRDTDPFRRRLVEEETIKGGNANRAYNLFVGLHAHRLIDLAHSRFLVPRRIHRCLLEAGNPVIEGVRHIYFGHTHAPFSEHTYKGVVFHNTGSAIHNSHAHLLRVTPQPLPDHCGEA